MKWTTHKGPYDTLRVTEVNGTRYAYEKYKPGDYTLFEVTGESDNGDLRRKTLLTSLPGADAAKFALSALLAGVDPDDLRHTPGDMRAHTAGGGWGGWSRTSRVRPLCRKCGDLGPKNSNTLHMDGAKEVAADHWWEKANEAMEKVVTTA